mgnify:CR=1 FL=1
MGRIVAAPEKPAQSGRVSNLAYDRNRWGVPLLAPNHVGRKESSCNCLDICKETHPHDLCTEPSSESLATVILGFGWGGWTLEKTAKEMANQSAKDRRRDGARSHLRRQISTLCGRRNEPD